MLFNAFCLCVCLFVFYFFVYFLFCFFLGCFSVVWGCVGDGVGVWGWYVWVGEWGGCFLNISNLQTKLEVYIIPNIFEINQF